jgi:D-glycero-D-manno-heptose 1,7-bisphosphate phosphatase
MREAEKEKIKKAAFLDRDGTICEDVAYLSRVEDLQLFPFAAEAIRILNKNDFFVCLVTNQSGIGRGIFDENVLGEIHAQLKKEFGERGAHVDAIYFCSHAPEDGCQCRKPQIGMIEQATKDFQIDLKNSWMIGDKAIDVETGYYAKTKTALVLTGYGAKEVEKVKFKPDLIGEDLLEVVRLIIKS